MTSYIEYGTPVITVPNKMLGYDKNNNPHLYATITKSGGLKKHLGASALKLVPTTSNYTAVNATNGNVIQYVKTKKPRTKSGGRPKKIQLNSLTGLPINQSLIDASNVSNEMRIIKKKIAAEEKKLKKQIEKEQKKIAKAQEKAQKKAIKDAEKAQKRIAAANLRAANRAEKKRMAMIELSSAL